MEILTQVLCHFFWDGKFDTNRRTRDIEEIDADKFASFFLMPRKLVESAFDQIYSTPEFIINENSAFKLVG